VLFGHGRRGRRNLEALRGRRPQQGKDQPDKPLSAGGPHLKAWASNAMLWSMSPDKEIFAVTAQVIPTLLIAVMIQARSVWNSSTEMRKRLNAIALKLEFGGIYYSGRRFDRPDRPQRLYPAEADPATDPAVTRRLYVRDYIDSLDPKQRDIRNERHTAQTVIDRFGESLATLKIIDVTIMMGARSVIAAILVEPVALAGTILDLPTWARWSMAGIVVLVIMVQLAAAFFLVWLSIAAREGSHDDDAIADVSVLLEKARAAGSHPTPSTPTP
jgi:hypothetical protein